MRFRDIFFRWGVYRKRFNVVAPRLMGIAAITGTLLVLEAPHSNLTAQQNGSVYIGELTHFYRATQVQGHIPAHALMTIPDYLTGPDVDVRYTNNPRLRKEIPFVDTFTINRFLGGYKAEWLQLTDRWDPSLGRASFDYVIRDSDGQLGSRPDIIKEHLAPYLDAGYTLDQITLNLENIPWAIARDQGNDGLFGQKNPPASIDDWKWTVTHLATDIKTIYGPVAAPNFKIGNEFDTKKSFDGTADDYFSLYSSTYKILRHEFPLSEIAPGEFTRDGKCGDPDVCVYDTKDLLTQTRSVGIEPSYVPRSLNSFQNAGGAMPSDAVRRALNSYSRLGQVPAQIHQFGLLGQPFGPFREFGSDQGARRAAWEFQVLMGLQQFLRPARVFHWGGFANFAGGGLPLLNGTGYLRLFLDRYTGAKMYRLKVMAESGPETEFAAVAFELPGIHAIIASSFSVANDGEPTKVAVELPELVSDQGNLADWKFTRYGSSDTVFALIRHDLATEGNLKPEFNKCASCTAEPQRMATNPAEARRMISANWDTYEQAMKAGLMWKPIENLPYLRMGEGKLEFDFPKNEVLILEGLGG